MKALAWLVFAFVVGYLWAATDDPAFTDTGVRVPSIAQSLELVRASQQ